jgi:hypothetical protein
MSQSIFLMPWPGDCPSVNMPVCLPFVYMSDLAQAYFDQALWCERFTEAFFHAIWTSVHLKDPVFSDGCSWCYICRMLWSWLLNYFSGFSCDADLHLFCACCKAPQFRQNTANRLCFSRNRKLITLAYCTLMMARNRSSGDWSVLMICHFSIISVDISAVNI